MNIEAIYIHIPFCVQKCHYCDFISYPLDSFSVKDYCHAVKAEASLYAGENSKGDAKIKSIYVGGGTPSCLSLKELAELLNSVRSHFVLAEKVEITVECNPGTVDRDYFSGLREAGVNRISLGAQSFDQELLTLMGRIHNPGDVEKAVIDARDAGFENINLDLIYGLPHQSMDQWRESLARAVSLKVPHISAYGLKLAKDTPWGQDYSKGSLALPDPDTSADMFETVIDYLTDKGYIHYEISNFALPGNYARHNIVYWENDNYLGLGVAAASHFGALRQINYQKPDLYISAVGKGIFPVGEKEIVDKEIEMAETVFLGLRMLQGLDVHRFQRRFGLSLKDKYGKQVDKMVNLGLLELTGSRLKLSARGVLLANEVFMEFLP
ncbi:MAG: radical SAM family heme chaperone HemW [Bacillota bacterium]|jgi:oxygen-independent coproporphyrinogen-3 oxidase